MMEKEKVNDLVTKLRTTLLYEADFNHNNNIPGREITQISALVQIIVPEQCGSRNFRPTIGHTIDKRLVMDIARQKRFPAGICPYYLNIFMTEQTICLHVQ